MSSFSSRYWATLLSAILLLTASSRPRLLANPGVSQVTATRDRLYVKGSTAEGTCWLMERDSWESQPLASRHSPLQVFSSKAEFEVAISRWDGLGDRLYRNFQLFQVEPSAVTVPTATMSPLESPHYTSVLRGISARIEPFPNPASKKGLQVQMVEDALALDIHHAALNLNLSSLLSLEPGPETHSERSQGRVFHFSKRTTDALDQQVKRLSDAGVVISLIVLAYQSSDPGINVLLLHPSYDSTCPNHLGAFNTVTSDGVASFVACMEFLANRYNLPDFPYGRVSNFILGNEVNSHWFWSNRGHCTMEEFADDYLRAMRLAWTAVRKSSATARVYVSLEHHWNIHYPGGNDRQTFAARPFLDYFHHRAVEEGDFDWHVAFHPYPENLFKPRTWLDQSATLSADTPRITFKNIEQLTLYLSESSRQYDPPPHEAYSRRTRRVILSEQGFHADLGPEGELSQAAAYAYAYRKAAINPGIDSFILHRHVDHAQEGGLNLGLWTRKTGSVADPDQPRRIYEVFKKANQPDWENAFEFALPVIGISRWDQIRMAHP